MKLTIIAATGGVGRHLLDQALAAGHDVTAVARRPQALPPQTQMRSVAVDLAVAGPESLEPAIAGADAVLSALGPRGRAEHGIVSTGTAAITTAMGRTGVRRLVVVSVAGVMAVPLPNRTPTRDPGVGFLLRHVLTPLATRRHGAHYEDVALMEDALRAGDLAWTAVGVPVLTNGRRTGTYRTATGRSVRRGYRVSRADAAHFMLRALTEPATVRRSVAIAY